MNKATKRNIKPGEEGYLQLDKGGNYCDESRDGWICTRPKNHEGDHAAHGSARNQYATWPNETSSARHNPRPVVEVESESGWRGLNGREWRSAGRVKRNNGYSNKDHLWLWISVGLLWKGGEKDIQVRYDELDGGFMVCTIRLMSEGRTVGAAGNPLGTHIGVSRRAISDRPNPIKGKMLAFRRALMSEGWK